MGDLEGLVRGDLGTIFPFPQDTQLAREDMTHGIATVVSYFT